MKITTTLMLMFCACLLAACQTQVNTVEATIPPTLTPAPTAAPTPVATPNGEQSRKAIIDGLLAITLKASHMEVMTVAEDGSTTKTVIEFLPPDRKAISGDGAEYIAVGGKVYMKTANKAWFVAAMPASAFIPDPPTAAGIAETVSNARLLRKDTLNGKEMWVYGFTSTNQQDGQALVSKAELWVSLEDGLPAKYITDGETLAINTDSNGSSKTVKVKVMNTTVIDFNAPIKIEAPLQ